MSKNGTNICNFEYVYFQICIISQRHTFFNISIAKNYPKLRNFLYFNFELCFVPMAYINIEIFCIFFRLSICKYIPIWNYIFFWIFKFPKYDPKLIFFIYFFGNLFRTAMGYIFSIF